MNRPTGSEIYIGLMSGTSLDGVDVAIVDFSEFPPRLLHCATTPYSDTTRQRLVELCRAPSITLDSLYGLDAELGELYAESVNQALALTSVDRGDIEIQHCLTEDMVWDFQTKSLQGMKFKKFRNLILGTSLDSTCVVSQ